METIGFCWLFNGKSTQKVRFVPTAGEENRLKSTKDRQRDTMHTGSGG